MRTLSIWNNRQPTNVFSSLDEFLTDFDRSFASRAEREAAAFAPNVDVEEQEHSYFISVDLPGMKKEDIKVDMKDDLLTLSGERVRETKGEGRVTERTYGKFFRSFTLPKQIDREKIAATFENGVLHLTLPKAEEAKPREIKVQ